MNAVAEAVCDEGASWRERTGRLEASVRRLVIAPTDRGLSPDYDDLSEKLHERDRAVAALAHDVKNALSCVIAYAQLLERQVRMASSASHVAFNGAQTTQMCDRLASIKRIAARAVDTLDVAVQTTAAPEAQSLGRETLVPSRSGIDLVALVHRTLRESPLGTGGQRVAFSASTPQLHGSWDEVSLGRVLDNLFSNAAKYGAPDGIVSVSVDVEHWPAGAMAAVSVADNGIGIPPSDQPRLFEWRFRASNAADIPGAGIGLVGSREIVERLGGSISVTSREGIGSTFTVRLPLPS